ncbi:MAG: UDP-2,3-diacylglucosamine diphosphatase LpxI [Pseudooceanicola sp.]|nr:UDP-2,3-diacylglucosamine diphosphatase LpxI [Pseudooceanicola sp.]
MLALIAGQGRLPGLLAEVLEARRQVFRVAELEGFPAEGMGMRPVRSFRLEQLGTLISDLAAEGVDEVCFAGAIRRPALDPQAVDAATAPLVPRILAALGAGDDSALRAVVGLFEDAGLRVVGAAEIASGLLLDEGVPTRARPQDRHRTDAARAASVLAALAPLDIGQGCVVARGQVLAIETLPGTDWMLASLAAGHDGPSGGLLMKAPKDGQDRRFDLPAVGIQTVQGAAAAGLDGIVIAAGGVLVLDPAAVIAEADARGLFLWVRP